MIRLLASTTLMAIAVVAGRPPQPAHFPFQQVTSPAPTTDATQSPVQPPTELPAEPPAERPTKPPTEQPTQTVFTTQSDLVVLNLTVKDKKGRYVSDLPADAFTIFENKQAQSASFFVSEDAPVTVGLLLDSSGSMAANRELLLAAATSFVATSNSEDEIFALAFNDTVTAVLPDSAPFTADPDTLRRAMATAIQTRGRTALYDALAAGLNYLARGTRERKILIVVSDGGDNTSQTTAQDIWKHTQASNVVVYTVALVDETDRESNPKALKRIADATGGEAFRPRSIGDVGDVLRRIANDIRHAYTIGYVPSAEHDGAFHNVQVVVRAPNSRPVKVRTRNGYVAGTYTNRSKP
jgi:VWFA-related protein